MKGFCLAKRRDELGEDSRKSTSMGQGTKAGWEAVLQFMWRQGVRTRMMRNETWEVGRRQVK